MLSQKHILTIRQILFSKWRLLSSSKFIIEQMSKNEINNKSVIKWIINQIKIKIIKVKCSKYSMLDVRLVINQALVLTEITKQWKWKDAYFLQFMHFLNIIK